jgi:hypothetical protein
LNKQDQLLAQFGRGASQLIAKAAEPEIRTLATEVLEICADGLTAITRVDLGSYEAKSVDSVAYTPWPEAEGDVNDALTALRGVAARLKSVSIGPEEIEDTDFEEISDDDDLEESAEVIAAQEDPSSTARKSRPVDEVLTDVKVRSDILVSEINTLSKKLDRLPPIPDKWDVLTDLQDYFSRFRECLEATAAGVLAAIAGDDVEKVLPRYLNETRRIVRARALLAELMADVAWTKAGLEPAGGEAVDAYRHLSRLLEKHATSTDYVHLHGPGRRTVNVLRCFLAASEKKKFSGGTHLLDKCEDTLRSLEILATSYESRELVEHDLKQLKTAVAILRSSKNVTRARPHLDLVYGRAPELDAQIRIARRGGKVDAHILAEAAAAALGELEKKSRARAPSVKGAPVGR